MLNPHVIKALVVARNKGYWRDRASLMWSFAVPPFLIVCLALAFSKEDPAVFRVGYLLDPPTAIPDVLDEPYVDMVEYADLEKALQRVRHHQLDMLIAGSEPLRFWVNPTSSRSAAVEALFTANTDRAVEREAVEGRRVRYVDWVVPGILGMNLMFSGLFGVGYVIVRYRKTGVLKRLQATPVTPLEFVTSQLISRFLIMLVVSITIFTAANAALDLLMLGSYWHLLLVALVGNVALISIALVVSARITSEELANGVLNILALPMLLLSEVWFSLDGVPGWMQKISQFLPLTHMVKAARKIMVEGAGMTEITPHLLILAAMAAACIVLSARLFRWN